MFGQRRVGHGLLVPERNGDPECSGGLRTPARRLVPAVTALFGIPFRALLYRRSGRRKLFRFWWPDDRVRHTDEPGDNLLSVSRRSAAKRRAVRQRMLWRAGQGRRDQHATGKVRSGVRLGQDVVGM